MRKSILPLLLAIAGVVALPASARFFHRPDESDLPGKRALLNVRSAQYPSLPPDNRTEYPVLFFSMAVERTNVVGQRSGWFANPNPFGVAMDSEKYYDMLKTDKNGFNDRLKVFWLSMGGKEDIAYENCRVMRDRLDKIGIKYDHFEKPGGHTWPVWRKSLYNFAPLIFK